MGNWQRRWAGARSLRSQGFTLLELMVVMTIIAIFYFAVRPSFAGAVEDARRRAVLRQLVALFTQARQEAVGMGRLVRIVCEPDAGRFWAEVQVDPTKDRAEFETLRVGGKEGLALPEDFPVVGLAIAGADANGLGRGDVYCYPDGSTDGLTLTLQAPTGQETTIEMMATTGKVSLRG